MNYYNYIFPPRCVITFCHLDALLSAGWTQLSVCTSWFFLKDKVCVQEEETLFALCCLFLFYLCSYIYFVLLE